MKQYATDLRNWRAVLKERLTEFIITMSAALAILVAGIAMLTAGVETGIASRYGYNTGAPACGLPMVGDVAAHRTLPCGSHARVTRLDNGQSVVVKIIDRGPFVAGRIIDLAPAPAAKLGVSGLARVRVEPL